MIRVLPMPIANYRIDGKDLFTEHQMQAYTIECQESETPQREWQGLTDDEIKAVRVACGNPLALHIEFARAIEAKLKEKNSG